MPPKSSKSNGTKSKIKSNSDSNNTISNNTIIDMDKQLKKLASEALRNGSKLGSQILRGMKK